MLRTILTVFLVFSMNGQASALSLPWKKTKSFDGRCPFYVPSDNVEFNNKPSLPMSLLLRSTHYVQRKVAQAGGLNSDKKLVRSLANALYTLDAILMFKDSKVRELRNRGGHDMNSFSFVLL